MSATKSSAVLNFVGESEGLMVVAYVKRAGSMSSKRSAIRRTSRHIWRFIIQLNISSSYGWKRSTVVSKTPTALSKRRCSSERTTGRARNIGAERAPVLESRRRNYEEAKLAFSWAKLTKSFFWCRTYKCYKSHVAHISCAWLCQIVD